MSLGGTELDGFDLGLPAASVRLLLPRPGAPDLAVPAWNGNEFLHADGTRPTIRTYTPRRHDPTHHELDIDIVLHEHGAVPAWATAARAADPAGLSGPGRGYTIDPSATSFLLLGDESAIPAISQLLEHL
ncbi:MAG: siderophore-interacting protein, partial [Acidimicrobiales bacterium]